MVDVCLGYVADISQPVLNSIKRTGIPHLPRQPAPMLNYLDSAKVCPKN